MLTPGPTLGFLTKIKKLLETVCHNCGKIKANTVSHPYWDGNLEWFLLTWIPGRFEIYRRPSFPRPEATL